MSKKYTTTKYLVIVESPAKCAKIENYLGPGYKVMASFGHIRELNSLKNINLDNNELIFSLIQNNIKQKQLEKIRKEILTRDEVILASDDDREGEAIAWHICKVFNLNIEKTKRIKFNEITETAIQSAIKNPTRIDMKIVQAQQARQVLDLLVGFKISPILWKHISRNSKNALSAGRCQTPALQLIYDNQKIIDKESHKYVYNSTGYFTNKNLPFELNKQFDKEEELIDFLDGVSSYEHYLICSPNKKSFKTAPEPFTTSKIQQVVSNLLHYSPKDTMRICQDLYEGGHITYMRTDSKNYSKDFLITIKDYIDKMFSLKHLHDNFDSLSNQKNKNAQEAHEAIRPTNIFSRNIENLTGKHEKMYKLIWENTVESCMSQAEYETVTASINTFNKYKFTYKSELLIFGGWQDVAKKYSKDSEYYHFIQKINPKEKLPYKKVYSKISIKNQTLHYTEARLVQLLEEKGIGRPSTFSSLVEKIQERGYVKKENIKGKQITMNEYELVDDEIYNIEIKKEFGNENNKLVIQQVGTLVSDFLTTHFSNLFNYDFTRQMENSLDDICNGNNTFNKVCKECDIQIQSLIKVIQKETKQEYEFDDNHILTIGRYGPVIKRTDGERVSFIPIKKGIPIDEIREGKYSLEEVTDIQNNSDSKLLGVYKDTDVFIKQGKFGWYVEYGNKTQSLKILDISNIEDISLDNVISLLETSNILRIINENITIRKGPRGDYIFYKTKMMKKPKFFDIKQFSNDYINCQVEDIKTWITDTYKINL
jgi:DNA topoisomerase I